VFQYTYIYVYIYLSNKMQGCTLYLYLATALHVSGGTSTHHQERIQLYLQHLVIVTPLLLPAAIVEELKLQSSSNSSTIAVVCAPDDGWRYYPKHVEQFPDINKVCNVASCCIYICFYIVVAAPVFFFLAH
jgi:hypothetical protein